MCERRERERVEQRLARILLTLAAKIGHHDEGVGAESLDFRPELRRLERLRLQHRQVSAAGAPRRASGWARALASSWAWL